MDQDPRGSRSAQAARRRYLTLLFADLSDSTSLAGAVEPEHYLEVLEHLRHCAEDVVPRHGGTLVDFRGDGFMAMFGYPDVGEDDARRATEAALELHEAIGRGGGRLAARGIPPLNLHTGIHAGRVLLIEAETGPARFLLVGKAPNIAARLSDIAARNELLVSATTLGTERHFFETLDRGRLALPGEPEPVATWQVLRRSTVVTRFEARTRRGWTPFIGRRQALDRLGAALQDAVDGSLRTVSIVAAPGIGKTRLAEEFLARVPSPGVRVVRAYCESLPAAEPLQPFLQILRTLAPAAETVSAPGASIADSIEALQRDHPLVLFIDDWHWADEASRRVVAALRERQHLRLLILTTSRALHPADAKTDAGEIIELAPLDEPDAVGAIRALRPDADPFAVRRIQELAGGNPLFIEELCHGIGGGRDGMPDVSASESSAWLNTLIDSRVSRLPREQADLIRAAAIIGTVVPVPLLEAITGRGDREDDVRALAANDLLYPADRPHTLRFKHRITRDVVYNSIGVEERRETHLRVARILDRESAAGGQEEMLETLAYHYHAGAALEQAAHYAELAGHKAMAAPALDRARTQYRAALAALDGLPPGEETYQRWMGIAQRLGLACVYDPTRDQLDVFRRAVALASARGDALARARAEYWLGYITYALGDVRTAIRQCETALAVCRGALQEGGQPQRGELQVLALQVQATLGQAYSAACDHDKALAELDEVIAARRRHKGGGRLAAGSAYTLACKGASLGDRGRFDEAHDCLREALDAVADGDHAVKASVLNWQAGVCLWQGRWAEALAAGTEAAAIAERIESLYVLGMARAVAARARWRLEGDPQAIDALVRATSWLEARDKRLFVSHNYGWLAEAFVETGCGELARTYAARAIRRARDGDRFGAVTAYRALARLAWHEAQYARAEAYLSRALAAAEFRGSPHEIAAVGRDRTQLERARDAARLHRA